MKRQKYIFLIVCLLLTAILIIAANYEEQHQYDWDKVDESALNERQPPDKVMDALGVEAGMMVGEVGAGGGRYAVKMAERVGPAGRVYANDIAQNAIEYMTNRFKKNNINNITVILGTETDPKFPPGKLDLVYLTYTYRHLSKPFEVLKNIRPALKSDGILAIIESKPSGDPASETQMLNNTERAGYALDRIETFLKYDNIWVFKTMREQKQ